MDLMAATRNGQPTLDLAKVKSDLREKFQPVLDQVQAEVSNLQVDNEETERLAVQRAGEVKQTLRRLDDARKRWISEPDKYVREVNSVARYWKQQLQEIESALKTKVSQYQQEERRRAEENARLAREEAKRQAEEARQARLAQEQEQSKSGSPAPAPAPEPEPEPYIPDPAPAYKGPVRTESGSAYQRKEWTYQVLDQSQVPEEFKQINGKAIKSAIQSGTREIPGLNIYEETKTVIR